MALTLYAAIIPSYLQILESMSGLIGKAEGFCGEQGIEPEVLIEARLAADMQPLTFQLKSTAVHSWAAIEGVRKGLFTRDTAPMPTTFAGLRERVAQAKSGLEALDPAEVESFIGRPMRFEFGTNGMDFVAEEFLLSFAQPNFYFHAATAYDILRMKGVEIGKRDFLGGVRKLG